MTAKSRKVSDAVRESLAAEPAGPALPAEPHDPYLIEMARRRAVSFGMLKGQISLSEAEALAPLDEEEIKAWGLG